MNFKLRIEIRVEFSLERLFIFATASDALREDEKVFARSMASAARFEPTAGAANDDDDDAMSFRRRTDSAHLGAPANHWAETPVRMSLIVGLDLWSHWRGSLRRVQSPRSGDNGQVCRSGDDEIPYFPSRLRPTAAESPPGTTTTPPCECSSPDEGG